MGLFADLFKKKNDFRAPKLVPREFESQDEMIRVTLLDYGFEQDDEHSYSFEDSIGINDLSIGKESIYMHSLSKNAPFSDSGTLNLPIKNAEELLNFISFQIIRTLDDENS